ncbi:hypothetical protein Hdeb2414_s0010g00337391 [Helianthus debilis subsp. tardiflorus]
MLVDELEEDEADADVEREQGRLSPESTQLLKALKESFATEKAVGEEGDNEEQSSSISESEIDETECLKRIRADIEKEKQLKRKRREEKDDDLYIPSPEHSQDVQTPPSSGGRKKSNARKRVVTPKVAKRLKILLKNKPIQEPNQPPEPSPPQSPPHQSPPPQQPYPIPSPPKQPSPPHSSPQPRISTPIHKQPIITSPHILQTPPTTQPPVQTTPGSSTFKGFPQIPENVHLEDWRFQFCEHELVEADQADIDILKVRIVQLEEEKAWRDEQNEYFKLKNKELEAINAEKEHEMYMMNKVLESLIGKSVEQKFEEIQLEEVRARRKAEIEAEIKDKGKSVQVEGVSNVTERAIVPAIVPESPVQNPYPISSVSEIFDVDVEDDNVNDDEVDGEEDDDDVKKDDADDVFSPSSHDKKMMEMMTTIKVLQVLRLLKRQLKIMSMITFMAMLMKNQRMLKVRGSLLMIKMLIKVKS